MSQFKIFLVGSSEAPLIEAAADSVGSLAELARRTDFIEGELVGITGHLHARRVLVPLPRVQMIAEADDI